MLPVYILTNDKHLWLLQGFAHLFNKYWSSRQRVIVCGFSYPGFRLPPNFEFYSLDQNNWPAQRWSDALIEMCRVCGCSHFVLMLEDFWLTEAVNSSSVRELYKYVVDKPDVLRLDLSGNRASYAQCKPLEKYKHFTILYSPPHTPYQMSFQAAIWNRDLLIKCLVPGETPWETEVNGCARVRNKEGIRVLGVQNQVVKYTPVYRTKGHKMLLHHLPKKDLRILGRKGFLQ